MGSVTRQMQRMAMMIQQPNSTFSNTTNAFSTAMNTVNGFTNSSNAANTSSINYNHPGATNVWSSQNSNHGQHPSTYQGPTPADFFNDLQSKILLYNGTSNTTPPHDIPYNISYCMLTSHADPQHNLSTYQGSAFNTSPPHESAYNMSPPLGSTYNMASPKVSPNEAPTNLHPMVAAPHFPTPPSDSNEKPFQCKPENISPPLMSQSPSQVGIYNTGSSPTSVTTPNTSPAATTASYASNSNETICQGADFNPVASNAIVKESPSIMNHELSMQQFMHDTWGPSDHRQQ